MSEKKIRKLLEGVESGRVSRRSFMDRMVGLGLTLPMASGLLFHAGLAQAQTVSGYKPTKRGGGGPLKVLWWQGATLLNPHFAVGTKDQEGSRIFYEPLGAWSNDGDLIPILAVEAPNRANGGVSADGKTITWKLKRNVTWHDGKPFTADDVVFTWEYCADPATSTLTHAIYKDVKVEKVDAYTVRVLYTKAQPFWADPFVSAGGMIIPKHLFDGFRGAKSREAPTNLKPVGTGPYKFVDFKPGDMVRGDINTAYHEANRPFFDSIEMKGGGDAVSAARAVIQTGEYDYAWNLQVEDDILKRLEVNGKGKAVIVPGGNVEFFLMNTTDPAVEVDGERASLKTKHPILSDPAVREAFNLLIDRQGIQDNIYGRTAFATRNFLNNPAKLRSPNTKFEFDVNKAIQVLEAAGWKAGSDGIRAKDGKKLKFVFQTSINAPRQKTQAIIKQSCQKAGIDLELKSVPAAVFFSSDVANPDTYTKFYCDLEMFTTTMTQPDGEYFMNQYCSWQAATKENKWQGRNITRWQNADYDQAFRAAETEMDLVKRAALFVRMNDLVVENRVVVPIVFRPRVQGISLKLYAPVSGWDLDFWLLKDWFKEA